MVEEIKKLEDSASAVTESPGVAESNSVKEEASVDVEPAAKPID